MVAPVAQEAPLTKGKPRFRARIQWVAEIAEISPAGWHYVIVDHSLLPSQQVIIAGTRSSQPEALEAACSRIKTCSGGGQ